MTKQELSEYYWIRRNITKLEDRLVKLKSASVRVTTQLKQDPINGRGGVSDRVGDSIAEIEEVIIELDYKVTQSYRVLASLEKEIDRLPARENYLIRSRYIEMLSWEQIAVDMNYGWAHIHRIHAEALRILA